MIVIKNKLDRTASPKKRKRIEENMRAIEHMIPGALKKIRSRIESLSTPYDDVRLLDFYEADEEKRGKMTKRLTLLTPDQKRAFLSMDNARFTHFLHRIMHDQHLSIVLRAIRKGCGDDYLTNLIKEDPNFILSHTRAPKIKGIKNKIEFYAKLFSERMSVDEQLQSEEDVKIFLEEHPEIAPYIRLHFHRLKEKGTPSEKCFASVRTFINKMTRETGVSLDSHYVPSVGLEVEVTSRADSLKEQNDYHLTSVFGIPNSQDARWEFTLPPTDARMQTRLAQELIAGDWIARESMEGNKYTMHLNIGIPSDIDLSDRDAGLITYILSSAYADETRLRTGKFQAFFEMEDRANFEANPNTREAVGSAQYRGRLELRSLSVIEKTLYRTVFDSSLLAACCFAANREERSEKDEQLADLWKDIIEVVQPLFKRGRLNVEKAEQGRHVKERALDLLLELQPEIKRKLRELTRKAAKIVEQPEPVQIKEIPEPLAA